MRISMVSEHASPLAVLGSADAGGQNVYVAALSAELGRRGHQVVVHTRRSDPHVVRRVDFTPNIVVDHVDAGPAREIPKDDIWSHLPAFVDDLRRQLEHDQPDIVHAHFWMSGIAALRATEGTGIPVAQTFHALGHVKRRHQGAADTSPPERLAAEQEIVDEVDRIIATCSEEAFELRGLGRDMRSVSVVPCGVNLANFAPDGPVLDLPRQQRHRIVTVSRLVPRKGVDIVIRALADVPDTELLVVGGPRADALDDDPEVQRLRAVADEAGTADRVRFLGSRERHEVPAVMRSSDVLVTVPWYEPFGMVPLEAMACGLPVVTAAVGGMTDTVVDRVTGVHVPPRDPEALAVALDRVLADADWRAALGRAGIDRVHARYGWPHVTDGVLAAYAETIGVAPARTAVSL
jgi:D-inositol-3-phosphate glycosyltransferase